MTSSKNHFPRCWPFVWRIHRSPVISLTRPVTRSLDGFFDPCLNKRLSKQLRCRWFETPSRSLLRQSNVVMFRWILDFYLMSNTRLQTYWYTNISDLYRCSSTVALCHGFESRVPISLYISIRYNGWIVLSAWPVICNVICPLWHRETLVWDI